MTEYGKYREVVTVRVSRDVREEVKIRALREGVSAQEILRRIIYDGLAPKHEDKSDLQWSDPTIIPSAPGFYFVEPTCEEGSMKTCGLSFTPIIAWVVVAAVDCDSENIDTEIIHSNFRPVTLAGCEFDAAHPCYLTPKGEFVFPHDETFDSKDDVIEHFNRIRGK